MDFSFTVEQIRAGDRGAEADLVHYFEPRLKAFVAVRTTNPDLMAEVLQETLMGAICAIRDGKIRQPDALPSFIYGVAKNQFADAIRRKAREHTVPLPEKCDFAMPIAEKDPELMEAARREIAGLSATDRRILWMTLIDGYKPGEVATTMGLSSEVVRQRKSRALKQLIEKLQPMSRSVAGLRLTERGPR